MENFKIVKPFGPSVVKVKIPEDIIDKLNSYIDEILNNNEKTSKLDHGKNLVGDVTQEFKLERKIMEERKSISYNAFINDEIYNVYSSST